MAEEGRQLQAGYLAAMQDSKRSGVAQNHAASEDDTNIAPAENAASIMAMAHNMTIESASESSSSSPDLLTKDKHASKNAN